MHRNARINSPHTRGRSFNTKGHRFIETVAVFLVDLFDGARDGEVVRWNATGSVDDALGRFLANVTDSMLSGLTELNSIQSDAAALYAVMVLRQLTQGCGSVEASKEELACWLARFSTILSMENLRRAGMIEVRDFPGPTSALFRPGAEFDVLMPFEGPRWCRKPLDDIIALVFPHGREGSS